MTNESIFPPGRVTIVGVINMTPDSFSDGGRFVTDERVLRIDAVLAAADELVAGGAEVLDVGGESTRPGASEVSIELEPARTAPVIEALAKRHPLPIAIDTRKAPVARAAIAAGARIINDVSGLSHDPSIAQVAAESSAILILGHTRGTPETMQLSPEYDDVMIEVARDLSTCIAQSRGAGLKTSQLVVDPGIGFGKRLEDNLSLIAHAGWLRDQLGLPLLVGPSRKSFLGAITGDGVHERDIATQAACAVAAFVGADAVRVHDAAGAKRAVAVGSALRSARRKDLS